MAYIKVDEKSRHPVELHYHDNGIGQPVVLIHGWPLSERSWEKQEAVLLDQGYRVITYDRRGFGESSKPVTGYDYDSFAEDLNVLMSRLDLQNTILVGFSMGAGEVARYLGTYGSARVSKAVFISGITPALLKADDNPEGVDQGVFDDMIKKISEDRPAFLTKFLKDFYSHNMLGSKEVSDEVMHFSWTIAALASPIATVKCVSAWLEDFRNDIARIKIPTLIIHGDADRILPIQVTAQRLRGLLPGCQYVEIKGGPHGLLMSHPKEVNKALVKFIGVSPVSPEIPIDLQH